MDSGDALALRVDSPCSSVQNHTVILSNPGVLIAVSPSKSKKKTSLRRPFDFLAGGEGFEPPLAESESAVLPLDDPPNSGPGQDCSHTRQQLCLAVT